MIRALDNMQLFLKKGEKWAEENNVSKESLIDGKMADDMKVLSPNVSDVIVSADGWV